MAAFNASNATILDCTEFEEDGGGSIMGVPRWIIGVIFGLLGSIAINTGNNIQSLGLMHLEEEAIRIKTEKDQKVSIVLNEAQARPAVTTCRTGTPPATLLTLL